MANAAGAAPHPRLAPSPTATPMRPDRSGIADGGRRDVMRPAYRRHGVLRGRLARSAKYLLPILAIALAAAILVWSQANLPIIRLRISDTEVAPNEVDAVSMANPRFAGTDDRNRQFTVTAATAMRNPDNDDIIHLQQPKADILMQDGAAVTIDADKGRYRRDEKLLDLSDSVTLHHERGYEFHTDRAHVDLERNLASGDAPIDGTMPHGTLAGEGFRIEDNGARILLLGRSRVVLEPGQKDEGKAGQ